MVTVSLQAKNGIYQAVLNYVDEENKRQQKWKSTGLTVKWIAPEKKSRAKVSRRLVKVFIRRIIV